MNMNAYSFVIVNGSLTVYCMVLKDELLGCLLFASLHHCCTGKHLAAYPILSVLPYYPFAMWWHKYSVESWMTRYVLCNPLLHQVNYDTNAKVSSVAHLISIW